ncbi:MAG: tubulin-like doman-containing protein [Oscillospiraceae bacterium]|jgi:hypothetical protein|nr:tubulin-like doman-containing protein [Oscillospiraceae bacterium]
MSLSKLAKEKLESELLLSKGGGVYFDAARVKADESTATIFVGLGGTGADMLIRIKNEVKRRMILPQVNGKITGDTPSNIGFLALDTDAKTKDKTWGVASFDKFGSEYRSLSVDNLPAVVNRVSQAKRDGDPVWDWWSGEIDAAALAGQAANGIRQLGRLMLFQNAAEVYQALQSKIKKITNVSAGIKNVMVFIVTGIAGGTGSGTFIDVAYLARKALEDSLVQNKQVYGYIVMPDVNLLNGGGDQQLWRNGFACLKELDYWMCADAAEQDVRFVQKYPGGVDVNMIQSRPFDFCHLLSSHDMEGRPLTYDKVIGSMAENIFAYVAGEVSTENAAGNSAAKQMYDNIGDFVREMSTNVPLPGCYRYIAVGTHKIEIPYSEISTLIAVRLFEKLAPILALRPTEDSYKRDLTELQLVPTNVIHQSLLKDVPPSPAQSGGNYKYEQIWGKAGGNGFMDNAPFRDVYQWIATSFQPLVTRNFSTFADVQNGIFLNFIAAKMRSTDRGPAYLAALVKSSDKHSVIPLLTELASHCDSVAATCDAQQSAVEAELLRAYNEGASRVLGRPKAVEDYLAALQKWVDNENGIFVYAKRAEGLRKLRDDYIQPYHDRVFGPLDDILSVLPDIFNQNLSHIEMEYKKASELGQLDETKLIWPLAFEKRQPDEFQRLLNSAIVMFLDALGTGLNRWIGVDFNGKVDVTDQGADIPGFISEFISRQFGEQLKINMEDIMSAKLGGAEIEDYVREQLVGAMGLINRSVPMFAMRNEWESSFAKNEFSIVSVPSDCEKIKYAAEKYVKTTNVGIKISEEKTRLYVVKVTAGIPLYAYANIETAEARYEQSLTGATRAGVHLRSNWIDGVPSPLPEGAWTPGVYTNKRTADHNAKLRAAFDTCLSNGVITPDNPDMPTQYSLRVANIPDGYFEKLTLTGAIAEQMATLEYERGKLWSAETAVPLPAMGVYRNNDREHLSDNVRESVLRLPRLCEQIRKQAELLAGYEKLERAIGDPKYFADAVLIGLIAKQGFEILLKDTASAASGHPLYDVTTDMPYGEFEAYRKFRELLDDKRRTAIEQLRRELFKRISSNETEKTEAYERLNTALSTYREKLPGVSERIARAAVDARDTLVATQAFFETVIGLFDKYIKEYLS